MELGFGTLETLKEDKFDHFVCREIQFKSNMFGEFVVYQLHYTDWPDHGRPETVSNVYMHAMHMINLRTCTFQPSSKQWMIIRTSTAKMPLFWSIVVLELEGTYFKHCFRYPGV